jgi:hypothetical protein
LLDDVANILKSCRLAPDLLGELIAQFVQIDLAQIERRSFGLIVSRRLRPDSLVHDPVQFLEQFGHVRRVAPFGQLFVNRLDVVVALGIRAKTVGSISSALKRINSCRASISNRRLASSLA